MEKAMNDPDRLQAAGRLPFGSVYLVHAEGSPLEKTLDACARIARRPVHVLIEGERGTGKETLARHIHELSRATGPFVPIGDDALAGADPGLLAGIPHGATVYVENVEQLARSIQASLVHHMNRDGGGCRVVASTTRAPSAELEGGRLRGDLLDLLACSVPVPPLRTRPEDVVPALLAACDEIASGIRIETDATERLAGATWPGNVGELRSLAARLCVFANDDVVTRADVERCSMQRRTSLRPGSTAALDVSRTGRRNSREGQPFDLVRHLRDLEELTSTSHSREAPAAGRWPLACSGSGAPPWSRSSAGRRKPRMSCAGRTIACTPSSKHGREPCVPSLACPTRFRSGGVGSEQGSAGPCAAGDRGRR